MVKLFKSTILLGVLPSVHAFRNTSPLFLFSTADLLIPNNDASILDSSSATSDVLVALKNCPTQSYIIVEQEGVSAADYAERDWTPKLSQYMGGKQERVRSTLSIPDIVGQIDSNMLVAQLQSLCAPSDPDQSDGMWLSRLKFGAPAISRDLRSHQLRANDASLQEKIADTARLNDYTVIYLTSAPTESQVKAQAQQERYSYDMENAFAGGVQMELKRDLSSHAQRTNSSQGGLFERYQYFTPGLFMGFMAIVPLFLLLVVGVRALTSLEVSYFAFSKEMGPNVQKKQ